MIVIALGFFRAIFKKIEGNHEIRPVKIRNAASQIYASEMVSGMDIHEN